MSDHEPRKSSGPKFVQTMPFIVQALRDLGNSGRPEEVYERVAKAMRTSDFEFSAAEQKWPFEIRESCRLGKILFGEGGYY
jgi:hypothetical protein